MAILKETRLKVAEIYKSIHGEAPYQGKLVCIVRLSGCIGKCLYCDSKKYWVDAGETLSIDEILDRVDKKGINEVLITGGEPLYQYGTPLLIKKLLSYGFNITLETDGSYSLRKIPKEVTLVMDIKTPESHSRRKPLFSNLRYLKEGDVLKFVVVNIGDYSWAKRVLTEFKEDIKAYVFFSPVYDKLSPGKLAGFMVRDNSRYRIQIQLHKYLGLK